MFILLIDELLHGLLPALEHASSNGFQVGGLPLAFLALGSWWFLSLSCSHLCAVGCFAITDVAILELFCVLHMSYCVPLIL